MALRITLTRPTVKALHQTALTASQAGDHAAVRRGVARVPYAATRCIATVAAAAVHVDVSWGVRAVGAGPSGPIGDR